MSDLKKHMKAIREHLGKKEYQQALQQCSLAVQLDSSSYDAHLYRGKAAFELKQVDEAEAAYQRALEISPQGFQAWQGLAEVYAERGDHEKTGNAYDTLVRLAAASSEPSLKSRLPVLLRKLAESRVAARDLAAAEAAWTRLTEVKELSAEERLLALCRLANVQLRQDEVELEQRVARRMSEEAAAGNLVIESVVRSVVEGEWADEALELESDHACHTLREIIAQTPPSAPYVTYHDAYLRRLRRSINNAPPGTMERHNRRMAMLQQARQMIFGKPGEVSGLGGSCSPYAYEEALKTLEVEEEVVGVHLSNNHHQASTPRLAHAMPILLHDVERITVRLVHSFPWSPVAQVNQALALCRRLHGLHGQHGGAGQGPSTDLNNAGGVKAGTRFSKRQHLIKHLLRGLKRGTRSAAGWIAVTELFLDLGAVEAAMDSARQGLKYVAARQVAGREQLLQAGLSLRLLLAKALLRMQLVDEAEVLFAELANWVSEGEVSFVGVVGMAPMSVRQQGIRGLAQVSMARGDSLSARQRYEEIVAMAMLGHSHQEPWAHADYGWLLYEEKDLEKAKSQLEQALQLLNSGDPRCTANPAEKAEWQYKLGCVYWELGEPYLKDKQYVHAVLLEAAAVEGLYQAPAFTLLGRYYQQVEGDESRARQCFQRALQLDPSEATAGEALCSMLERANKADVACQLCQEILARQPNCEWAAGRLAPLQVAAGQTEAAVASFQRAIVGRPADPVLWESLGAAYQSLARYTSALKAYNRALDLDPSRLYSRLQAATLHFQLADPTAAIRHYRQALTHHGGSLAALLGLGEALLAAGRAAARSGAFGLAAGRLKEAAALARAALRGQPNLQSAWKLLGDSELQHAGVTPLVDALLPTPLTTPRGQAAQDWVQWGVHSMQARKEAVRRASLAYRHLLHMYPGQGLILGDLGVSLHQQAALSRSHPALRDSKAAPLQQAAERAVRGGLRLHPDAFSLWHSLSVVAAQHSTAEYAAVCALRLEPHSGATWGWLGRLYARAGAGGYAAKCYEEARSVEPTLTDVWEAMGELQAAEAASGDSHSMRGMLEAWEHAVGLGGGLQSQLGFAAGSLVMGSTKPGLLHSCALKSVAQQPLAFEAHNLAGLGQELRGNFQEAAGLYRLALDVLDFTDQQQQQQQSEGQGSEDDGQATVLFQLGPALGSFREAVSMNLARVLVKSGQAADAMACYRQLAGRMAHFTAPDWVVYGYGLCQVGSLDEAMQALSQAMEVTASSPPPPPHPGRPGASPPTTSTTSSATGGGGDTLWAAACGLVHVLLQQGRAGQCLEMLGGWRQQGRLPTADAARLCLKAYAGASQQQAAAEAQAAAAAVRQLALEVDRDAREPTLGCTLVTQLHSLQAASLLAQQQEPSKAARVLQAAVHSCPWDLIVRGQLMAVLQQRRPHATAAAALRCLPKAQQPSHGAATPPTQSDIPDTVTATATAILCQWGGAVTEHSAALRRAVLRMLHSSPGNATCWYLMALLSTHLAAGCGAGQEYRRAVGWCKAALQKLQRLGPDSLPPLLVAAMKLQLLISFSEAHLQSRPANEDMALRCAQQAARMAASAQLPAQAAQRQLARVLEAVGRCEEAAQVLAEAQDQDAASAVSLARLKAGSAPTTATQILESAGANCAASAAAAAAAAVGSSEGLDPCDPYSAEQWPAVLVGCLGCPAQWQQALGLERALLLREAGDLAAARTAIGAELLQGPPEAAAPANLARGAITLQQALAARAAGDKEGVKEAGNDANYSLRQAAKGEAAGGGGLAALLLLAQLEVARGRQAQAGKLVDKVAAKRASIPAPLVVAVHATAAACAGAAAAAAAAAGSAAGVAPSRVAAAAAVHQQPWNGLCWRQLSGTACS